MNSSRYCVITPLLYKDKNNSIVGFRRKVSSIPFIYKSDAMFVTACFDDPEVPKPIRPFFFKYSLTPDIERQFIILVGLKNTCLYSSYSGKMFKYSFQSKSSAFFKDMLFFTFPRAASFHSFFSRHHQHVWKHLGSLAR